MGSSKNGYWDLMARYLKGNLSEQEKNMLSQWVADHPDNKETFTQIRKIWEKVPNPAESYHPDVAKGWKSFKFRIDSEQGLYDDEVKVKEIKPNKTSLWPLLMRIAAVFIMLAGVIYFVNNWLAQQDEIRWVTRQNETKLYHLPDSSQVWLNEHSELAYSEDFNVNNRVVFLKGEGFFEVQKAEGKRFTVYTETTKTEVIGTAFNINAYDNEQVNIQVVHGKVAFSLKNADNSVFLEPGAEGIIQNDQTVVQTIENLNFRAWQNKQLVFNNTRLDLVAKTLEDYFDVQVHINNPALANCRYTATFDHPDINEILNILTITGNLSYDKQGNQFILNGQGCD